MEAHASAALSQSGPRRDRIPSRPSSRATFPERTQRRPVRVRLDAPSGSPRQVHDAILGWCVFEDSTHPTGLNAVIRRAAHSPNEPNDGGGERGRLGSFGQNRHRAGDSVQRVSSNNRKAASTRAVLAVQGHAEPVSGFLATHRVDPVGDLANAVEIAHRGEVPKQEAEGKCVVFIKRPAPFWLSQGRRQVDLASPAA